MDRRKLLHSADGTCRDWRGLAEKAGFTTIEIEAFGNRETIGVPILEYQYFFGYCTVHSGILYSPHKIRISKILNPRVNRPRPTIELIKRWCRRDGVTVFHLADALSALDRDDVIADVGETMVADCERALSQVTVANAASGASQRLEDVRMDGDVLTLQVGLVAF